jgi:small-conductance mechanosensitive channel
VIAGLYDATITGAFAGLGKPVVANAVKVARGALFAAALLFGSKLLGVLLLRRVEDRASRYNLERVRRLLTGVGIVAIVIMQLMSKDWRTTMVSLGLVSLLLGFALQTPITSLIGWVYILVRQPYRVGDRLCVLCGAVPVVWLRRSRAALSAPPR